MTGDLRHVRLSSSLGAGVLVNGTELNSGQMRLTVSVALPRLPE